MAYGMKIYGPDGVSVAYDSTSPGGVFIRFVVLLASAPTNSQSVTTFSSIYRGMTIELYPLVSGDHSYYLVQGNVAGGLDAAIYYQSSNSIASDFTTRKPTILMAFAK
jgi:hypothetical protein